MLGHIFWRKMVSCFFFFFYPSVYNTSFVRSVAAVSKTVSHFHKSRMFSGMIWAALYFPSVHSHNFTLLEQFFTLRRGCIAEISEMSEILQIYLENLWSKAFSVSLSGEEPLSILLIVTKAGNDCGKLPLKVKEEDKKRSDCELLLLLKRLAFNENWMALPRTAVKPFHSGKDILSYSYIALERV